jgi:hypothetical protein
VPRFQNCLWVHAPGTPLEVCHALASKPPFICQDENIYFLQSCYYETKLSQIVVTAGAVKAAQRGAICSETPRRKKLFCFWSVGLSRIDAAATQLSPFFLKGPDTPDAIRQRDAN